MWHRAVVHPKRPEGVTVEPRTVASPTLYLQCKLPDLGAGNAYVDNVGLHVLKSLVFLSGGQTVYQIDDIRRTMWPDYINSLGVQQKATFLAEEQADKVREPLWCQSPYSLLPTIHGEVTRIPTAAGRPRVFVTNA